jgi:hypothetical protein
MDPLEADSDSHPLMAAAFQTQRDSEKRLQELWPRLRMARDKHGASSQEYRNTLETLKVEQELWWENTVILTEG